MFPTETQINTAINRYIYFFNNNFNINLPSTLKFANICTVEAAYYNRG
jgi:hypothetical protein